MTWGGSVEQWRAWLIASGKPPQTTVKLMTGQIRRLAVDHPTSYHLTTDQLALWLASHDWAPATIKCHRAAIRSFYGWLHKSGKIKCNPAADLPSVKVGKREPQPAPEVVVIDAIMAADDRTRLMLLLAARQGLRRGEIARVHSRDLIATPDGWSLVVHGKGSKDRTIPLFADVAALMRARPSGWVFPSPVYGHLSEHRVGVVISSALPCGWTAHSLRRRFATRAYEGAHDLRAVQMLLGHASIETTERYIAMGSAQMREAMNFAA